MIMLLCIKASAQQVSYLSQLNKTLKSEYSTDYSEKRISSKSKRANSIFFLEIGYFINSNNIVGNKDISYDIIENIIQSSPKNGNQYKWTVKDVSSTSQNYSQKGKEFMLYEGYMFRYIAEFQYKYPDKKLSDPDFVKDTFFKWYNQSKKQFGDASTLYGQRLHIGSHWATVAAYLSKIDSKNKKQYSSFVDAYDKQLKKALKIVNVNGKECYTWNATYSESFTNLLKKKKKETLVQDVSHGNHVVQYVIDSYNLGSDMWTKKDLERFANTLKYLIWKNESAPSDLVDGTSSKDKHAKGTGWKQSDGWMKLMVALNDKKLYEIYDAFYKKESSKVNKFYPNIQYFAVMSLYQTKKK